MAAAQGPMAPSEESKSNLVLEGVIGFNGGVAGGLVLHPDDEHLIFPLGSTVVVRNLLKNTQIFLQKGGHDTAVSALAISKSGKFLASGQTTHMGFVAPIVIWNLETCEAVHRLELHKGGVQALAFSPHEKYLVSLGGQDDNKLVVWDVAAGDPICGATAANDQGLVVQYLNNDDDSFVTAGRYHLRTWALDLPNRKIRPTDCNLGNLKRVITCVNIDDADEFMYCGTETGDLLQVSVTHKLFKVAGPKGRPLSQGIRALARTRKGNIIAGAGDGTVAVVKVEDMSIIRKMSVSGSVSSLQLNAKGDHFFVGTRDCNTYLVQLATFDYELRSTCHSAPVNWVAFPAGYSELFATCSGPDIRVWNARTRAELLRVTVPNLTCYCVDFSADGKSIISGWSDGSIRGFLPQSGKLKYTIKDAHDGGVFAIAGTSDSRLVVSGGREGSVRVWDILKDTQRLLASMKEHKGPVNHLQVNADNTECLSASDDGACIMWSLTRFVRNNALFASTQFKAIEYHPDQSQILTAGTDRKITYWDAVDASAIRVMDASAREITCLAVARDGDRFVSAGVDRLVKVWSYDEGFCYYQGVGHSGSVNKLKISPDGATIVSVGAEGAIFMWRMPQMPAGPQ